MTKAHPTVAKKLRESLKKWSENEFKSDPQLNLIPTLLSKLKTQGLDFSIADTVSIDTFIMFIKATLHFAILAASMKFYLL